MVMTATTIIGMGCSLSGEPPSALAVLNPQFTSVWPQDEDPRPAEKTDLIQDNAPILLPLSLKHVIDGRGIPSAWDDDKTPFAVEEHAAYCYVLYEASRTSEQAFANSAVANRHVTWRHLWTQPRRYRGEVVHMEGRLKRLSMLDVPAELTAAGVKHLYEGWMFNEQYGAEPTCILITDLPAGLEPAESLERRVRFDGYFFKKYRYKAADSLRTKEAREAPLLMGHSLTLLDPPPATSDSSWADYLVPGLLGMIGATVVFVIGMTVWFRRADSRFHARLAKLRATTFVESPADSPPLAMPVASPLPPESPPTASSNW